MSGSFIYVIHHFNSKTRVLSKKLKKSESSYRDLARKYAAIETLNQHLEQQQIHEEKPNSSMNLIEEPSLTPSEEMNTLRENPWHKSLNNLSLLIQDVSEAHKFGEVDDHYIDSFTQESMLLIKQMSRSINDLNPSIKNPISK
jgi:hypothetical protein